MEKLKSILPHLVLGLGLFFFFFSPAYLDLLTLVILRNPFPLPAPLPPLLLAASVGIWICHKTPEGRWVYLGRFLVALSCVYWLSIPHLSKLLIRPVPLLLTFLVGDGSILFLAFVTPSLRERNWRSKIGFILTGVVAFQAFTFFVFLLLFHADLPPLALTLLLLLLLSAAIARWAGNESVQRSWLLAGSILFFLGSALFVFSRNLSAPSPSESPLRVGPYLQNLKTDGVTVMWETQDAMPSNVAVGHLGDELRSGEGILTFEGPPGKIHEVPVHGLAPDTEYHYAVLLGKDGHEMGTFRTAPDRPTPFQFVVYADSSDVFDWIKYIVLHRHAAVCQSIQKYSPDARFLIHVGDLTFLGNEYPRWKKEFFDPTHNLIRNRVFWPTLGNHEKNASWYFDYFSVPNEDEHFYSFDYGNVHFIVLAVEGHAAGHEYGPPKPTPLKEGSPQYEWLKRDLKQSQHQTWHLAFFHQSFFSSGAEGNYNPGHDILSPLFQKYGMDVVFSGHDHDYEYSVAEGMVFVITGGGGSFLNPVKLSADTNPHSRFFRPTWHHCRVTVDADKLQVEAVDLKGRVFHQFALNANEKERS